MGIARRLHQEVVEGRLDPDEAERWLGRILGPDHEPCLFLQAMEDPKNASKSAIEGDF